ncbi:MAG: hypothetical protein AAB967_03980, partial [Patescibacteria group bacterium]
NLKRVRCREPRKGSGNKEKHSGQVKLHRPAPFQELVRIHDSIVKEIAFSYAFFTFLSTKIKKIDIWNWLYYKGKDQRTSKGDIDI